MIRCLSSVAALSVALMLACILGGTRIACAQTAQERIVWKIDCSRLAAEACDLVIDEITQLSLLANEQHIILEKDGPKLIASKGLLFPDCFIEGGPCPSVSKLMPYVLGADALAGATFEQRDSEWLMRLDLVKLQPGADSSLVQKNPSLENLLRSVMGQLFDLGVGLTVNSVLPGVSVFINDQFYGVTPLSVKIPAGNVSFVFQKAGYVSERQQLYLKPGQTHTVDLNPLLDDLQTVQNADCDQPDQGQPGSSKNDAARDTEGVTPHHSGTGSQMDIEEYRLERKRSSTEIDFGDNLAGKSEAQNRGLARTASLELTSDVQGISVYVGKQFMGLLPLEIQITAGVNEITFDKPGYVPETWQLNAEKGHKYSKKVVLGTMEAE
ncbi:MAG: PEGA domain-containing protein [Proteobacteria bacterium]|nr:PEGA domain-containing protein [Pseudomonadota bacterium]